MSHFLLHAQGWDLTKAAQWIFSRNTRGPIGPFLETLPARLGIQTKAGGGGGGAAGGGDWASEFSGAEEEEDEAASMVVWEWEDGQQPGFPGGGAAGMFGMRPELMQERGLTAATLC